MKIDAIVNDPFVGCSGYVKVPIDVDYVESDEPSIRDWIANELEEKYIGREINYGFEVENMQDILEDLKSNEFESKMCSEENGISED